MTLLLGSIRPADIVLTADGRSTETDNGVVVSVDDHFQKIFPIPDHPVAICHMGENDIGGVPIGRFVLGFLRGLNTGNFSILDISDQLREYAHPAIRKRFAELADRPNGCNFWVAGFSADSAAPALVELFWQQRKRSLVIEESQYKPVSVVAGGDGKYRIDPTDWHSVADKPVADVCAYHRSLMAEAMAAKGDHNTVGGDLHELIITRSGCAWTQPPRNPL